MEAHSRLHWYPCLLRPLQRRERTSTVTDTHANKATHPTACGAAAAHVPDKLFADRAEGRLWEEGGAELVAFDDVNFGLLDGAAPLVEGKETLPLWLGLTLRLACSI